MRRSFDGKHLFPLPLEQRSRLLAALSGIQQRISRPSRAPGLARNVHFLVIRMRTLFLMLLTASLLAASQARADGAILLAEILPSLAGTDLGEVEVGRAPVAGASLVIRRADVLRALRAAGKSGDALNIPRATKITREVVKLDREQLAGEAEQALVEAAAPCRLEQARVSTDPKVIAGPRTFSAELIKRGAAASALTMQASGAIFVESGGQRVRVPVVARLTCPPPDVLAGAQLTLVAVVGPVRASAPGEARQPGRAGEIIRVTNRTTGAALRGRIVDAQTVEVVP
jgi:hypothetical protein